MNEIYKEECDEVLLQDEYKGHKYVIKTMGYYPTAYVSVDKDIEDDYALKSVYCGITYHSTESIHLNGLDESLMWIGWDYGHALDYIYPVMRKDYLTQHSLEEIEQCCKKVIDEIIEKGL